jgi:hypothetical protein
MAFQNTTIDRGNEKHNTKNEGKKKKNALIDKFIENSKISPVRHGVAPRFELIQIGMITLH